MTRPRRPHAKRREPTYADLIEAELEGQTEGFKAAFRAMPIGLQQSCIVERQIRVQLLDAAPSVQASAFVAMLLVRNIIIEYPHIVGDTMLGQCWDELKRAYEDPSYDGFSWDKL